MYAVPDEVTSLRFDEISDRSVRVSWSPPEKTNGILVGYTVRWSVKDMPHTLKVKNVSVDVTSLVVNSLQVNKEINSFSSISYTEFFIAAYNALHFRSCRLD